MECPRAVLFDLDDTLAESFKPPRPEMVEKLKRLLDSMPFAIITAAGFARIHDQFLPELSKSKDIARMFIFPNSAAECYQFVEGQWAKTYSFALTPEERLMIAQALKETAEKLEIGHPTFKARIIDREAQVAFAAVGLDAPLEVKKEWDPDQKKRRKLKKVLEKELPEFEVLIGGMTTIDITRKGINKSYGVQWLAKELGVQPSEMLYIGDALFPGGNDEVVIPTGIKTRPVTGPVETLSVIEDLLKICDS